MLGRKAKQSLEKLGKARDYLDPALHVGDLDIPTKIALHFVLVTCDVGAAFR